LDTVVRKTLQHIESERDRQRMLAEMKVRLNQSLPLLREKFWLRAIRDGVEPTDQLRSQLSFLQIDLPLSCQYCIFLLSIDDWPSRAESMSEQDRQLASFALLNIVQEIVEPAYNGHAFEHRQGEYVCVLTFTQADDEDG